jgi:hypothetical protein
MRLAHTPSWRLRVETAQMLDIALFIRDAAGLVVTPTEEVPAPGSTGSTGSTGSRERTGTLTEAERTEAGGHWPRWWRDLMAHELRTAVSAGAEDDPRRARRRREAERLSIFDPPSFTALADRATLRRVAVDLFADARDWTNRPPDAGRSPRDPTLVDHALAADMAGRAAAELGVGADQVTGALIVLDVAGIWSHRPAPGVALCSVAAARDPAEATELLRYVFVSGGRR